MDLLALTPADLERFRVEIEQSLAEESLNSYTRLLWPVIEPGRPCIDGWAMDAISEHLEAVTAGDIRRLLINVPPGFRKSLQTCVFWPSWEWGPKDMADYRYLFVGYRGSLTVANNQKLRRLVESPLYQRLWGSRVTLTDDQNTKSFFENTSTGFALATSIGGTVMGKRGDRAVLDDPNNTKEADSEAKIEEALQFVTEVLPTRVNDETTFAQVTIMQRTGERDIAAHLIDNQLIDCHLCIPMEWRKGHPFIHYREKPNAIGFVDPRTEEGELAFPERFSAEGVERLKKELASWGGEYAVAGQLDQMPIPRGGGMFQAEWFAQRIALNEVPAGGVTARGWDLAGSTGKRSPFTASVKMRLVGGRLYILDCTCERIEAAALEDHIVAVSAGDDPSTIIDVPQDPGQAGKAQVSSFARRLHGRTIVWSPESGHKDVRAMPFASQCKGGNVVLVDGAWVQGYVNEAKSFPRGMFKDRIDASSRAYTRVAGKPGTAPQAGTVGDASSTVPTADPASIWSVLGGSRG